MFNFNIYFIFVEVVYVIKKILDEDLILYNYVDDVLVYVVFDIFIVVNGDRVDVDNFYVFFIDSSWLGIVIEGEFICWNVINYIFVVGMLNFIYVILFIVIFLYLYIIVNVNV